MSRNNLELLSVAYDAYEQGTKIAGYPMAENRDPTHQKQKDKVLRALDCAVINQLHSMIEDPANSGFTMEPFDTVRGLFSEGKEIYPTAGFKEKTHIQIAVRRSSCIRGLFLEPVEM